MIVFLYIFISGKKIAVTISSNEYLSAKENNKIIPSEFFLIILSQHCTKKNSEFEIVKKV
jgi:hypothetical protein